MDSEHFHIDVTLIGKNRSKKTTAMIDSGASTLFISKRFVQENQVQAQELAHAIPLYNIDGSPNKMGNITHIAELGMCIGNHHEPAAIFTVANIGTEDVIIGIDWLRKHNPDIDWDEGMMTLECCETKKAKKVVKKKKPKVRRAPMVTREESLKIDPEWEEEQLEGKMEEDEPFHPEKVTIAKTIIPPARFVAGSRHAILTKKEEDDSEGVEFGEWERMGILAGYTYSQQLAEKAHAQDQKKSFEEMIPTPY